MSTKGRYLGVFSATRTRRSGGRGVPCRTRSGRRRTAKGLLRWRRGTRRTGTSSSIRAGRWGRRSGTSETGVADVVNELTVFVVVRAASHEAAARLFEGHPHFAIFPCDGVDVMPLLGPAGVGSSRRLWRRALVLRDGAARLLRMRASSRGEKLSESAG
jgi:hypothetical protein